MVNRCITFIRYFNDNTIIMILQDKTTGGKKILIEGEDIILEKTITKKFKISKINE